jgi:hypothetical protein
MFSMKTKDYYLSTTLIAKGFSLFGLELEPDGKFTFEFEQDEKLNKAVSAFYKGHLKIDPRIILLQAKLLKDRMYANRR